MIMTPIYKQVKNQKILILLKAIVELFKEKPGEPTEKLRGYSTREFWH